MLLRIAPLLFVLLWSSGFIASKAGSTYAEPFTFLAIRFAIVLSVLIPFVLAMRLPWPDRRSTLSAMTTGVLIHSIYLGGVLWALRLDMPAGVVALIVATQPIFTALLAGPLLGEDVNARHWFGLVLGLLGVGLILSPKLLGASLDQGLSDGLNAMTLVATLVGLAGITIGTLNQKINGAEGHLLVLTLIQYVGAIAITLPLAVMTETMQVDWTLEFIASLAWLVIALSIGAIGLLMLMIRASAVSRVTSYFYLVPAMTAFMAWIWFGEQMTPLQLAGVACAMLAVLAIARNAPRTAG